MRANPTNSPTSTNINATSDIVSVDVCEVSVRLSNTGVRVECWEINSALRIPKEGILAALKVVDVVWSEEALVRRVVGSNEISLV